MKFTEVQPFIKYLKTRSYNLDIRYGKEEREVLLTVCFFQEQREILILNQQERECITYIQQAILYQQPDSVEVEITSDVKSEFHQCIINNNVIFDDRTDEVTDDYTDDISDDNYRRMNETDDFVGSNHYPQQAVEQDIEEIINKRLDELRKEREIIEIKSKLLESAETITHQKQAIESFKQSIEDKNKTIEGRNKIIEEKDTLIKSLNQKISHKNTLEYYAQLAGEVIQNTHIKKEDIGKVLGGILPQNKSTEHKDKTDESGIIEE